MTTADGRDPPHRPDDRAPPPRRGSYDRALIHSILDEGLICHVGFVADGRPFVIPTIHVRVGDRLYMHGSPGSRMLKAMAGGVEVCVTVTLVDGLVLARSAFHHSMNYRSVVVFGTAQAVDDPDEKARVLRTLSEHLVAGPMARHPRARRPASSRRRRCSRCRSTRRRPRSAPALPSTTRKTTRCRPGRAWSRCRLKAGVPVPCPRLAPGIELPPYASSYPGPGDGSQSDY